MPQPLGGGIRLPDLGQIVAAEQMGKHCGVDLVGLHFRLCDGLDLQWIADHDLGHEGPQDLDHCPGVGGGFQGQAVVLAELLPRELLQGRSAAVDRKPEQPLALGVEGTDLQRLLVQIQANVAHAVDSFPSMIFAAGGLRPKLRPPGGEVHALGVPAIRPRNRK